MDDTRFLRIVIDDDSESAVLWAVKFRDKAIQERLENSTYIHPEIRIGFGPKIVAWVFEQIIPKFNKGDRSLVICPATQFVQEAVMVAVREGKISHNRIIITNAYPGGSADYKLDRMGNVTQPIVRYRWYSDWVSRVLGFDESEGDNG